MLVTTFSEAVQAYRQTTFDKDAAGFNALLHPEVTGVLADGETVIGRDATAAWIEDFFTVDGWTQTLDVVRQIELEGVGFVLLDSIFTPKPGAEGKALAIGVTFVEVDGQWLVLHNQDSTGPIHD